MSGIVHNSYHSHNTLADVHTTTSQGIPNGVSKSRLVYILLPEPDTLCAFAGSRAAFNRHRTCTPHTRYTQIHDKLHYLWSMSSSLRDGSIIKATAISEQDYPPTAPNSAGDIPARGAEFSASCCCVMLRQPCLSNL